jgi:hypothetical protein
MHVIYTFVDLFTYLHVCIYIYIYIYSIGPVHIHARSQVSFVLSGFGRRLGRLGTP